LLPLRETGRQCSSVFNAGSRVGALIAVAQTSTILLFAWAMLAMILTVINLSRRTLCPISSMRVDDSPRGVRARASQQK